MQILLLDNYDSFTYNLYDYLLRCGAVVRVVRNDEITLKELAGLEFDALVLSPGPKRPSDAGILMDTIAHFYNKIPMLGVCLGHQALGEFFGAKLIHALLPMHGKTSNIQHTNTPLFDAIPNPMQVMRYHSLTLTQIPDCLCITGQTAAGEVMAMQHRALPLYGVQFHPESVGTPDGIQLIANWLKIVKKYQQSQNLLSFSHQNRT